MESSTTEHVHMHILRFSVFTFQIKSPVCKVNNEHWTCFFFFQFFQEEQKHITVNMTHPISNRNYFTFTTFHHKIFLPHVVVFFFLSLSFSSSRIKQININCCDFFFFLFQGEGISSDELWWSNESAALLQLLHPKKDIITFGDWTTCLTPWQRSTPSSVHQRQKWIRTKK